MILPRFSKYRILDSPVGPGKNVGFFIRFSISINCERADVNVLFKSSAKSSTMPTWAIFASNWRTHEIRVFNSVKRQFFSAEFALSINSIDSASDLLSPSKASTCEGNKLNCSASGVAFSITKRVK